VLLTDYAGYVRDLQSGVEYGFSRFNHTHLYGAPFRLCGSYHAIWGLENVSCSLRVLCTPLTSFVRHIWLTFSTSNVRISNAQNGARIKAWAGPGVGSGIVKNVTFAHFVESNVDNPLIIDQVSNCRPLYLQHLLNLTILTPCSSSIQFPCNQYKFPHFI
jgi:hypothetical protein